MNNQSPNVFSDISTEAWREYRFPCGAVVRVEIPTHLSVSKSGGHRLLDASGISHYVPAGWIHLYWEAFPGMANFVK